MVGVGDHGGVETSKAHGEPHGTIVVGCKDDLYCQFRQRRKHGTGIQLGFHVTLEDLAKNIPSTVRFLPTRLRCRVVIDEMFSCLDRSRRTTPPVVLVYTLPCLSKTSMMRLFNEAQQMCDRSTVSRQST